jgi:putative MFS transporter
MTNEEPMTEHHILTAAELDTLRRLERLPMSWFQGKLLLMGGLGYTFDAVNNAILAFILPPATSLFKLSSSQTGLLGSSILIGFLIGAFSAGVLGDLIGRKRVMMYALALFCVGSLLGACSQSFGFLFGTRILTGIGTGAESTIVAPFLAEFIQSKYRGRFLGSLSGFFSFGFVLAAILGYGVVPATPEGWRIVQVLTALPIVILLWWRRALPESPRWLMQQGRSAEAERVVSAIEVEVQKRVGRPLPDIDSAPRPPASIRRGGSLADNLRALWGPNLARSTVMLWVLWISITFAFYGFFTWIPSLLVMHGLTVTKSFAYSIVIYVAQIPGYYTAAFLTERLDRKWTIILYMALGGLSAFLMAQSADDTMIITFGFFLSFFMNGTYAGIYAYTPEIYPTAFRATGMGVASAFGRIGGILGPIIIGFTFNKVGFAGVFGITTIVLIAGALVVCIMGIRTTGMTLEQITAEEISTSQAA